MLLKTRTRRPRCFVKNESPTLSRVRNIHRERNDLVSHALLLDCKSNWFFFLLFVSQGINLSSNVSFILSFIILQVESMGCQRSIRGHKLQMRISTLFLMISSSRNTGRMYNIWLSWLFTIIPTSCPHCWALNTMFCLLF